MLLYLLDLVALSFTTRLSSMKYEKHAESPESEVTQLAVFQGRSHGVNFSTGINHND